ncbi:MAG: transglutaminase-like domain-containing protein [Flavobacteriales bacterium]|jgi:regulator of sirC expression with transglutaminase-like and TPR domain|nr:transglutaminase family protein [Flavobacteriales bacterium]MCI1753455.1 transglutaminase-like domain-containing protein [Flavobacteriales bacterium]
MSDTEIHALITLIDDPDESIYSHVRERILTIGEPVVPELERAWEMDDLGDLFRNRIEDLLHSIHFDLTFNRLKAWSATGGEDLLEGALAVCRYRYSELDEHRVKSRLAAIRQDIWLELNDNLTAFEKVRVFNHIFFQVHGFKGNKRNYHAPQNSYINEVLEGKKGNPLSLALIYQLLAEDLDLPLRGVNLPNHFVLAYMDETGEGPRDLGYGDVLFYVNAFSNGDILGKAEIDEFLGKLELPADESFYNPCTNIDIVRRLLNNLLNSYEKLNDPDRVEDLQKLLTAL